MDERVAKHRLGIGDPRGRGSEDLSQRARGRPERHDRRADDSVKATRIHPGLQRKLPEAVHAYQLEEAETAFDGAAVALSGVNSFGVRWASSSPTSDRPPGRVGDRAGPPAAALGRPGRPRRRRPDPSTPAMHPVPTVLIPRGSGEPPWILR
jgi:hypothetical protein